MSYTVMVKWEGRQRAERLGNGYTTNRNVHAWMFPSKESAELLQHDRHYNAFR